MKAKYLPSIDEHLSWIKSLAYNMARKTVDPSIGWQDLQQEGLLAVHKALQKGTPHIAYLKVRARGAMMDAMRKIHFLPSNRVKLIRQVEKAQEQFGNVKLYTKQTAFTTSSNVCPVCRSANGLINLITSRAFLGCGSAS